MEKEIPVRMTNFALILNDLAAKFEGRNEYIDRLCRFPLLITTNHTPDMLENPQDTAHARIYDRLIEMCSPVCFMAKNFRKEAAKAKLDRLKELILSILVDTFFSKISLTMRPVPNSHNNKSASLTRLPRLISLKSSAS